MPPKYQWASFIIRHSYNKSQEKHHVNKVYSTLFSLCSHFTFTLATVKYKKYLVTVIFRYIFHIKPHFSNKYCEDIPCQFLINFIPLKSEYCVVSFLIYMLFSDFLFERIGDFNRELI